MVELAKKCRNKDSNIILGKILLRTWFLGSRLSSGGHPKEHLCQVSASGCGQSSQVKDLKLFSV